MEPGGARRRAAPNLRATFALVLVAAVACAGAPPTETSAGVLRVLLADDWAAIEPIVDAVRDFERDHPGVRVQIDAMPFNQIIDAVQAGIDVAELHDVAQFHAFAAAARGLAEPLDDLWAEHLTDAEYLPGAVTGVTWAGRRYGVPLDTNAMVLMANADEFAGRGIDLGEGPRTFADLEALARAATAPDGARRGIALPHSSWRAYGWVRANGGEVVRIDSDGTPTFTFDDPQVVEAFEFLERLVADELAFLPSARDISLDAFDLYRSGSVSLHASGAWDAVRVEEAGVAWRQQVMPLPGGVTGEHAGSALGGSSLFVPAGSSQRELAFELMLHLTSDPYALRYAVEQGRLPSRLRVFDDPAFQTPALRVAFEQLRTAHPMMLIAFPEASEAFSDAIVEVLVGEADARTALARAQQRADRASENAGA